MYTIQNYSLFAHHKYTTEMAVFQQLNVSIPTIIKNVFTDTEDKYNQTNNDGLKSIQLL